MDDTFLTVKLDGVVYKKLLNIQFHRRQNNEKSFFKIIISDLIEKEYDFLELSKKQEALDNG